MKSEISEKIQFEHCISPTHTVWVIPFGMAHTVWGQTGLKGSLMKRDIPQIHSFLSTCIAIIMFTSFFQGSGIAFLVEWLGMTLKSLIVKADFAGVPCLRYHGANESLQNFYKNQNKDIEKADETEIEQRQREIIDSDGLGLRPRIGIN